MGGWQGPQLKLPATPSTKQGAATVVLALRCSGTGAYAPTATFLEPARRFLPAPALLRNPSAFAFPRLKCTAAGLLLDLRAVAPLSYDLGVRVRARFLFKIKMDNAFVYKINTPIQSRYLCLNF
jgi:hypothetical protein